MFTQAHSRETLEYGTRLGEAPAAMETPQPPKDAVVISKGPASASQATFEHSRLSRPESGGCKAHAKMLYVGASHFLETRVDELFQSVDILEPEVDFAL